MRDLGSNGRRSTTIFARIGIALALLAGLSSFSVGLLIDAPVAVAGGTCTSPYAIYYKAGTDLTPNPSGVQGDLSVTPGIPQGYILCSGHPNSSNWIVTWLLLQPPDVNGGAESGTVYVYGYPCVKTFAWQDRGLGYPANEVIGGCVQVGNTVEFFNWVFWDGFGLSIYSGYFLSGTQYNLLQSGQAGWEEDNAWGTPITAGTYAGATYNQSDIPGNSSSKFWNTQIGYEAFASQFGNGSSYAICNWGTSFSNLTPASNYADQNTGCGTGQTATWTVKQ